MAVATRPRLSILVVEENRDEADILSLLLEHEGHRTAVAYDARRALILGERLEPEAILLDLRLAETSPDLCRRLRAQAGGRPPPMIVFTGTLRQEDMADDRTAEADGYLLKPATPGKLLAVLDRVAAARAAVMASLPRPHREPVMLRPAVAVPREHAMDVCPVVHAPTGQRPATVSGWALRG